MGVPIRRSVCAVSQLLSCVSQIIKAASHSTLDSAAQPRNISTILNLLFAAFCLYGFTQVLLIGARDSCENTSLSILADHLDCVVGLRFLGMGECGSATGEGVAD